MLKHHCSTLIDFLPMLKHHRSALLTFLHYRNTTTTNLTPISPIIDQQPFTIFSPFLTILHRRNNTIQQLFRLFFSIASNFSSFFPMLKHHCSTLFLFFLLPKHYSLPFPHHSSSTKQHRPAIVSPLSFR
jgi:hypothetical protein